MPGLQALLAQAMPQAVCGTNAVSHHIVQHIQQSDTHLQALPIRNIKKTYLHEMLFCQHS